jgi:hypothetical protein
VTASPSLVDLALSQSIQEMRREIAEAEAETDQLCQRLAEIDAVPLPRSDFPDSASWHRARRLQSSGRRDLAAVIHLRRAMVATWLAQIDNLAAYDVAATSKETGQ